MGWVLRGELAQLAAAARVAELAQRLDLDLADPLAGQAELLADFLERPGMPIVEAEAEAEDPLLATVERGEHVLDLLTAHAVRDHVERRDRVLVGDELAELRVALVADRRLERDGLSTELADLLDALRRHRRRLVRKGSGDLGVGGLATELRAQLADHAGHATHRLDHV